MFYILIHFTFHTRTPSHDADVGEKPPPAGRRAHLHRRATSSTTPEPPKGSEAYQTPDYLRPPPVPRSPPLNIQLESDIDPYHGGPSALEKAANLFFFTEIVRGA